VILGYLVPTVTYFSMFWNLNLHLIVMVLVDEFCDVDALLLIDEGVVVEVASRVDLNVDVPILLLSLLVHKPVLR
jgi:hypothetical protein